MDGSVDISDCAQLVQVRRNGAVESRHYGVAVVLGENGSSLLALGNPEALIFPRSALKPFQAIASLRCGAQLTEEQVALTCASHVGSFAHQQLALQILESAGLSTDDLQCPEAWPVDSATRTQMTIEHLPKSRLTFNCSGKHAGFLNAAKSLGADTDTYLDPAHPVQQTAHRVFEEFCGPVARTGVDGCGAPAVQMSLLSLARGFHHLLATSDPDAQRAVTAMLHHPWAVRGEGQANTEVIKHAGVIAKLGAEGVLAMTAPNGVTVAIKMLDGSSRGTDLLALSLLHKFSAIDENSYRKLHQQLQPPATTVGAQAADLQLAGTDF
ncbi:asparaginase [Arthrobacter sp. S41]|uniref:asparaginase n=1 Tax=Arthrobacter sp. S41 TaxID=2509721 RepID=UPI001036CF10|nr:asparaginase [Arthrobacter sp. S41]TAP28033.1 asparaginase [Arthrobacter sp. S41]